MMYRVYKVYGSIWGCLGGTSSRGTINCTYNICNTLVSQLAYDCTTNPLPLLQKIKLNRNSMNTVSITDQVMRSLLQKAVRRGNTEMVNSVLQYFLQTDQDKWLRNRLAVITVEECWPYYGSLMHH